MTTIVPATVTVSVYIFVNISAQLLNKPCTKDYVVLDKIYLFQKHGFIPSHAKFRLLLGELGSNLIIQLDRTSGNL